MVRSISCLTMKPFLWLCVGLPLVSCSNSMPRTTAKPPTTKAEPVRGDAARRRDHRSLPLARGRQLESCRSGEGHAGGRRLDRLRKTATRDRCWTTCPSARRSKQRLRPLMEVGAVTRPIVRANRYFFSKREGNQNQPVVYWREGYKGENQSPGRSGPPRRVRPDDGRVVFAVTGRPAPRLRHLSRRRRDHHAAPARGRQRQACSISRFPTRPRRPTGCPTDRVSSIRT